MSETFIATLKKSAQPASNGHLYQCQNCYRPQLPAKFVAFVSNGEAYCSVCVKA